MNRWSSASLGFGVAAHVAPTVGDKPIQCRVDLADWSYDGLPLVHGFIYQFRLKNSPIKHRDDGVIIVP